MKEVKAVVAKVISTRPTPRSAARDRKKALAETGGDLEKAIDVLRKAGSDKMAGRTGRTASEGSATRSSG